ncbi:hypothetical protein LSCM1_02584 [Leishmania martiniquensis]|uniref:Guanine nucleotide-binding protein subunit beta-like protein n=1 Tax=Leishmania martiniquensis TaxID=1580590 RepID=A0A836GKI3_9TRYP|nr:hypothetical protein LSCM1_02584 [Leishmania martiniquensis]
MEKCRMGSSRGGRERFVAVQKGARAGRSKDALPPKCIGSDDRPSSALGTSPPAPQGGHPTPPPTSLGGATTAMSGNAPRHAATCAASMHQWILAVKPPPPPTEAVATPSVSSAAVEKGMRSGCSTSVGTSGSSRYSSASAVAQLPLEERIGLLELKSIMRVFQVPQDGAAGQSMESPVSERPHGEIADHIMGPQALDMLRSIDELSAIVAVLPRSQHAAHPPDQQGARDAAGTLLSAACQRQKHSSAPASSLSEPSLLLRNLSQDEFIQAIRCAVPSAALPEIQALLTKAISETQDTVSWNDLATFLATRSRQKADLALENQRFVVGGPPCGMDFDDQHSSPITCVAVEPGRRLLVTGCSEGCVRAWSGGSDLAYRGLLLQVDKWIVGLHWGCKQRVLYVVTMDRWVYVLDGTSYEVLRAYHGRGITESSASMTYASETIGTVHVGGVALTKRTISSARSYGAPRFSPKDIRPLDASPPPRPPANRAASRESKGERMRRKLLSAMHSCRIVQPASNDTAIAEHSRRRGPAQTDCTCRRGDASAPSESLGLTAMSSPSSTTTLATTYLLTTANVAEVLHQDNTPLTGAGRGPYVRQQVNEGVLTALVDPVTATAFQESAFQEDVLLLGTSAGDVFLFQLAQHHHLDTKLVLVARHVFHQLHHGRVTKLDLLLSLHALVSSGDDGHVRVTSLVTGQPLRSFHAADLPEQHVSVTDFDLHPHLKMLLTVGPERHALVWEWTQPSPIALLGPANSPCCGGAFVGDRVLTLSRDGVLHVYDCKGFHLQQELSLASASSFDRCGSGVGATRSAISKIYVDEGPQRVVCFGHFPVPLRVKWQISTAYPERYRGHYVPILRTLSSRAFRQVVTVGTDGIVMTWTPRTGANEFSFLLSNFSNATSATPPLRPTAASMDVLQRCLLTGFANGIMVVWNILNGQAKRVLTAALGGTARKTARPTSGRSSSAAASSADRMSTTTAAATTSSSRRDVTAVGSFLRHRSVSYIFAIGSHLYVDTAAESAGATALSSGLQLGEFSTTPASSWTLPSALGEVTKLLQLGSQLIGCATASGAVLLYNVLFDRQESAPLWVCESHLSPAWATGDSFSSRLTSVAMGDAAGFGCTSTLPWRSGAVSPAGAPRQRRVSGGTALFLESLLNRADAEPAAAVAATTGAVVSRVSLMMTLSAVHPRLLIVGQEDGTVSLWHTLRRVCLGAVSLTSAAGVEDSKAGEGAERGGTTGGWTMVAVDIDETEGRVLVFGDGEGNVHVCRVKWKVLTDLQEQAAALAMPNLALYCRMSAPAQEHHPTVEASAASSPEDATAAERSLPVLQQLERVHVFASGLVLAGIRVIHAGKVSSTVGDAAPLSNASAGAKDVLPSSEAGEGFPELSVSLETHTDADRPHLVILCTGVDRYVRLFTLAGVPIGELGMDEWDTTRPSTFRFLGKPTVPPALPLSCPLCGNVDWQHEAHDAIKKSDCYHDYLADLYETHHTRPAALVGPLRRLASSGSMALRRTMGSSTHRDTLGSPSPLTAARTPSATHTSPALDVEDPPRKAGSVAGFNRPSSHGHTNTLVFGESTKPGTSTAHELPSNDAGRFLPSELRPDSPSPIKRCLRARLTPTSRHRYETGQCFRGLLKHSHARQLLHCHWQGCAPPLSSDSQPLVALPVLPSLLLGTSSTSTGATPAPAGTWSNALLAANDCSSSSGQSRASEHFLRPLGCAAVTSASFLDERHAPGHAPIRQHRSVLCKALPPTDVEGPMMLRRSSTASTDAPGSAVGSPRNRVRQSCATVAALRSLTAVPHPNSDTTEARRLDLPASEGSSLVSRAPPLPAEHASADTQSSSSSHAVSASAPMLKTVAPLPAGAFQNGCVADVEQQRFISALSFLSNERARLVKSTCTAATREHLAALAIPTITHSVSAGGAGDASAVAALQHLSSTLQGPGPVSAASASPSLTPALDVHKYVDSILEKRRSLLGGRAPVAQEATSSSKRFLAEVTSRMYLAPVEGPPTPFSDVSRPHHSATTPPSRMRQ